MTKPHSKRRAALSVAAIALSLTAAAAAAPAPGAHRPLLSRSTATAGTHAVAILHSFNGTDGSSPQGDLDLAIGYANNNFTRTLYGEAEGGGSAFSGTIYSYSISSPAFNSLYSFSGAADGGVPLAGLANNDTNYFVAGQTQVGVTISGGNGGQGTLFAIGANGKPTTLHAFTGGADGGNPAGRLTQFTDGNYYGTTTTGGLGFGTIFRLTSSGQFSTIYSFTGGADGGTPRRGLALRVNLNGNANAMRRAATTNATSSAMASIQNCRNPQYVSPYLYGTTSNAGAGGVGTIFRITPSGKLQTLYAFSGNGDGGVPVARLSTDLNGNLYGSTSVGGSAGNGVVFRLAQNSNVPQVIHDFGNGAGGASPEGQITVAFNGNLYGTTSAGGASGQFGTVFEITSGGQFSDIHDFAGSDGANPEGALVDGLDGKLYGTTTAGGAGQQGVLFSITE